MFLKTFIPAVGLSRPPVQLVLGLFPGVKRPGCGVDNPFFSSTKIKNE
jgi:hypothetical protein